MSTEYHKIETLFERDILGTKKLIEGKFRSREIEYLKDNEWEWREKVDGTNIRIIWDGHKVSFGGRTNASQIPSNLYNTLSDMFSGSINEELFEQTFGDKSVVLYGEGYGSGIQQGGDYRKDVSFILFDIMIDNIFLNRENVIGIAQIFNLDVVPIMLVGTISDAVTFVKSKPVSLIAKSTKTIEGLVGTPTINLCTRMGKRIITKIKLEDFT